MSFHEGRRTRSLTEAVLARRGRVQGQFPAAVYQDTPQEIVEALVAGLLRAKRGYPTQDGRLNRDRALWNVHNLGPELTRLLEQDAASIIRQAAAERPFECPNCAMRYTTEEKADACCKPMREFIRLRDSQFKEFPRGAAHGAQDET